MPAAAPPDIETLGLLGSWNRCDTLVPRAFGLVTRALTRPEIAKDPRALEAVKNEGVSLIKKGTWLEDTVIERADLIARSRQLHQTIHLGQLFNSLQH